LSEEAAQDAKITVGDECCSSVLNLETWNGEVPNFRTVASEAATLLIEANLWNNDEGDAPENMLLVAESKESKNGESVYSVRL
jgi:hypothetical protein